MMTSVDFSAAHQDLHSHSSPGNGFSNVFSNGSSNGSSSLPSSLPNEIQVATPESSISKQPSIPHIVTNLIPFSQIVSNLINKTYKDLITLLKTFDSSHSNSDQIKKRKFIEFLVLSRKEFIKLYVLSKWAFNSIEISQIIDILGWLRGQQNCFQNLIWGLKSMNNSLLGAKLPNPDINTAIEVLKKGRPSLPTHGFIDLKPLSPQIIMKTQQDLNILLSLKLSLLDSNELPKQFYNYKISNGRVTLHVDSQFEADLGIADNNINSPFFLIQFRFLIDGSTNLPDSNKKRLEITCNEVLSQKGLPGLYEILNKFTISYKLYTIHKRLLKLRVGLWSGCIKHTYYPERSIIILRYWIERTNSKNIIEIGVTKNNTLGFRWFKDNVLVNNKDHGIIINNGNLDVKWLLETITFLHSSDLLHNVYNSLFSEIQSDNNNNNNNNQKNNINGKMFAHFSTDRENEIYINLTNHKKIILTIEKYSGKLIFLNNSYDKFMILIEKQLNDLSDLSFSGQLLLKLRLNTIKNEIIKMANATGWIINSNLNIKSNDIKKNFSNLFSIIPPLSSSTTTNNNNLGTSSILPSSSNLNLKEYSKTIDSIPKTLLYFRRSNWPLGWFLISKISSIDSKIYWWIGNFNLDGSTWIIKWIDEIILEEEDEIINYSIFEKLIGYVASRVMVHLIIDELKGNDIGYKLLHTAFSSQNLLTNINASNSSTSSLQHKLPFEVKNNESVLVMDMQSIMPNEWAHSSLYFIFKFENSSSWPSSEIIVFGRTLNIDLSRFLTTNNEVEFISSSSLNENNNSIKHNDIKDCFKLKLNFNNNNLQSFKNSINLFDQLKQKLFSIQKLIILIKSINSMNLNLIEASLNKITFKYENELLTIDISKDKEKGKDDKDILKINNRNPHVLLLPMLQKTLETSGLNGLIKNLKLTMPLVNSIRKIYSKNLVALQDDDNLIENENENDNQNMNDKLSVAFLCSDSTQFKLIYSIFVNSTLSNNNNNNNNNKFPERRNIILELILRSRNASKYVIHIPRLQGDEAIIESNSINSIWNKGNKQKGIVSLKTGLVCELKNVEYLLEIIDNEIRNEFKSILTKTIQTIV